MLKNNETKFIPVEFSGGTSRYSTEAVDYMLAVIETEDEDFEIYSELPIKTDKDGQVDELANYKDLAKDIRSQFEEICKENNITGCSLMFWF